MCVGIAVDRGSFELNVQLAVAPKAADYKVADLGAL